MKKKRVFSYNPVLILAIIGLSGSVYKAQLTHDADELKIINPVDTYYVSGSLVESSKDILVQNMYTEGTSSEFKSFLLGLPSRVLIYLNDNWIEFIDADEQNITLSYIKESDQVKVAAGNCEEPFVLSNHFYDVLGEIIFTESLNEELLKRVQHSYNTEGLRFEAVDISERAYFKLCTTLYFTDNHALEKYPQTYQMIESVLQDIGIL